MKWKTNEWKQRINKNKNFYHPYFKDPCQEWYNLKKVWLLTYITVLSLPSIGINVHSWECCLQCLAWQCVVLLRIIFFRTYMYRILPNKGAGRSSKVISIHIGTKLSFLAFQRWFRIENRTIIKEIMVILVIFGNVVFLQTMGGALIMGGALTRQITVVFSVTYYYIFRF